MYLIYVLCIHKMFSIKEKSSFCFYYKRDFKASFYNSLCRKYDTSYWNRQILFEALFCCVKHSIKIKHFKMKQNKKKKTQNSICQSWVGNLNKNKIIQKKSLRIKKCSNKMKDIFHFTKSWIFQDLYFVFVVLFFITSLKR